jgi:putative endonuclease
MISRRSRGMEGERAAVKFLKRRGYRIVASNYKSKLGEIDVIADDGGTLVFVEVKWRADDSRGGPAAGITPAKQARLARLAQHYLVAHRAGERVCRFDAVLITGEDPKTQRIELLPGAFDVNCSPSHRGPV